MMRNDSPERLGSIPDEVDHCSEDKSVEPAPNATPVASYGVQHTPKRSASYKRFQCVKSSGPNGIFGTIIAAVVLVAALVMLRGCI